VLCSTLDQAVRNLQNSCPTPPFEPLQREEANEVLLLHGTKPEVVLSILQNSLDPDMARPGMFGRGTYFAEDSAKIDQASSFFPHRTHARTRTCLLTSPPNIMLPSSLHTYST
jgi:hypothetical protein